MMLRCFLLYCLMTGLSCMAQSLPFIHRSVDNGLANSTVYYAMQDKKGYMWFCTESGVNRFDGRRFELFTIADGLADNENFKCMQDSKGRIWFMSYSGKLCYYSDTGFVNEQGNPALAYKTIQGRYISDMKEDKNGNIYFSTYNGPIYKFDNKSITECGKQQADVYGRVLFTDGNDMFTISFQNMEPEVYNLDRQTRKPLHYKGDHWGIGYALARQNGNTLYFNTTNGIKRLKNDSFISDLLTSDLGISGNIFGFNIIGEDLWLGTSGSGLFIIPGFAKKGFTGVYRHYLGQIGISEITEDNEHGVWISTMSDGVYYLPPAAAYISNIPAQFVTSLAYKEGSNLSARGTYYGTLSIYKGDRMLREYHFDPMASGRITGISWLSDDSLLLGLDYSPYIYSIRHNTARSFTDILVDVHKTHTQTGFSDMSPSAAGMLVCCRHDIFLYRDGNLTRLYSQENAGDRQRLVSIADGGKAGFWFTSLQTLYWYNMRTGKVSMVAGPETFKANIRDISFADNMLWVATNGNGVIIFSGNKPARHFYPQNNNELSHTCRELLYDGNKSMWITTNNGISIYNTQTLAYTNALGKSNAILHDDILDINLQNGKAYIATNEGISIVSTSAIDAVDSPPPVYIRNLQAAGRLYNAFTKPEFYYYNGVISLAYTAIVFQSNSAVRFRYKLKGSESNWNETSNDLIDFYNLSPGTYTLLISARRYNSPWSKPVAYSFTILPLWYQSWWFKVLLALLLAAGIYLFISLRIRAIHKRADERRAFDQRVAELEGNALASQMNPHFIFNSINSIQHFILLNDDVASNEYLTKFARLMRLFLESSKKKFTRLNDEIELLTLYTDMEKLRFEDKIDIHFHIDRSLAGDTEIPSMLVQPFVENAINHGLIYKESSGRLDISFLKTAEGLLCIVEDDGIGRQKSAALKQQGHISRGMELIQERMRSYAHLPQAVLCDLHIEDKLCENGEAGGTKVIISVKYDS